jgi:hypothetical protein
MPQRPISLTVRTLNVVTTAEEPMKAWEIARRLGCRCNTVRVLLGRLCDSQRIIKFEQADGVYFGVHTPDDYPRVWDLFR